MKSNNSSLPSNTTSLDFRCQAIERQDVMLHHYALIPAVVIIMILSFLHGHKIRAGRFIGLPRPGPVVPMHQLDGCVDRVFYGLAFAAIANDVIAVFARVIGDIHSVFEFQVPSYVKAIFVLFIALEATVVFYPVLACLTTPWKLIGGAMGLVYSTLLLAKTIYTLSECPSSEFGEIFPYANVVFYLPSAVCLVLLTVKYAIQCGQQAYMRSCTKRQQERPLVARDHEICYVKNLFLNKYRKDEKLGIVQRKLYHWRDDFKFSTKMVITMVMCGFFLYFMSILMVISVLLLKVQADKLKPVIDSSPAYDFLNDIPILGYLALVISLILSIAWLCLTMKNHRHHLLKMFAGNKYHIPEFVVNRKTAVIMTNSLKYSGYQIAYCLWGYLLQQFLLLIFISLFYMIIILPLKYGTWDIFLQLLQAILPPLLLSLLLKFIQVRIVDRFVLEDKIYNTDLDKPLYTKNRTIYENLSFLMMMWNLLLGAISCIMRIILMVGIGVILLPRLDRPVFMRGFEKFDKGYRAYIGFMLVEYIHLHPIMRYFAQIVMEDIYEKRAPQRTNLSIHLLPIYAGTITQEIQKQQPWKRVQMKWLVAYTLIKNPQLIQDRKHSLNRVEKQHNQL